MNYYYFAATSNYNSGAYGAGRYNEQGTTTSTEVTDGGAGVLPATGMPVVASVIGGVLLLVVGVVLVLKMRKKNK